MNPYLVETQKMSDKFHIVHDISTNLIKLRYLIMSTIRIRLISALFIYFLNVWFREVFKQ